MPRNQKSGHHRSVTEDDKEIYRDEPYEAPGEDRYRYSSKRRRKKRKPHVVRNIIILILLTLLLVGVIYLLFSYQKINDGKNVTNILLIGQDRREGEGTKRSDSIILASISHDKKKITLTSIMRDTYVTIPGHGKNRINVAYEIGGMKLLDQTIEQNLKVNIDYNAEVDFDGFIKAMTAVGNLDIELKDYEAEYLNVNSSYGGVENYAWHLKAGMNSLTPRQALAYSRIRYVGNSDWERTQRQRTVITTAFNKVKSSGPITMIRVASKVFPCLTTDMSKGDMIGMAMMVMIDHINIGDSLRVPFEGTYRPMTLNSGAQVLYADMDANAKRLHSVLYDSGSSANAASS